MYFYSPEQGVPYFRFETFPDHLEHGVLTRLGGVGRPPFESLNLSSSVPDRPGVYVENRARAYAQFGRSTDTLVHAHLVHRADVVAVTKENQGEVMPAVDGLITREIGCGLTMNFADCAPVVVYDPVRKAVGLGHAGWKGAVADLPGALVRAMVSHFKSRPADLLAAVGPCIGPNLYEVDEPLVSAVKERFPDSISSLLLPQPGKSRPHFDLVSANRLNFERAGVKSIELSGLCTGARSDLFFSHRIEKGKTGRFGVVVING